jgi:hypothetical protein
VKLSTARPEGDNQKLDLADVQAMLVTQIRQIGEANEERFRRIRDLDRAEICALFEAYENNGVIKADERSS